MSVRACARVCVCVCKTFSKGSSMYYKAMLLIQQNIRERKKKEKALYFVLPQNNL